MALRMASYCSLLCESLLQRRINKHGQPLSRLLPVVLYSGVRSWRAPTTTRPLFDRLPAALGRFLPQFEYLLIDEGELVRSGGLPEHNPAALLFRLEHNRGIEDTIDLMQTIGLCMQGEAHAELRQAFANWIRRVLLPRSLPAVQLPPIDDFMEIKDMLDRQSRSWTHQWKMQGLTEGRKEGRIVGHMEGRKEGRKVGRKEGRKEGSALLLQRQLAHKFGPLPAAVAQRLATASVRQMEKWSVRLLGASSLEDVFADGDQRARP